MATTPLTPPSYEMFIASAGALGAAIDSEGIRLERGERSFNAVWTGPGKSTPPRVRVTTPAGPLAQPPALGGAPTPTGGPFRGDARPRIESPAPLTLRFEKSLDRKGKSLHLNRETQTGDPDFDERVYLESEAPDALVRAALIDPQTRAGALECLTLGCDAITLDNHGNLGVDLALTSQDRIDPAYLARLLDALGATAEAIPPLQGPGHHRTFAGRIPLFAIVATLVSWPLFYLVDWIWEPMLADLYAFAALGGLALWIVTMPVLYFVLRGRSVSLRDLITCAVVLAVGYPLGATDLLITLNGALDTSGPEEHPTRVLNLRKTSGKNVSYHVTLVSWHPDEERIEITIGSSRYFTLANNQQLTVITRRGALGWERMMALVPATAPRTSN